MYMHPGVYIEHVPCLLWGFVGLWQRALQMIDNFKQTIIGGIQDFVINSLIMGGLSWLAGLSNPVGAVIKIALAIYNLIKTSTSGSIRSSMWRNRSSRPSERLRRGASGRRPTSWRRPWPRRCRW